MGEERTIISEQQFCDELLYGFGVGEQPPKVEKTAVWVETDIDSVLDLLFCFPQHHAEEEREEGGCKHTALLYTVGNGETVRESTVLLHLTPLAQPKRESIFHRPSLLAVSNALVRSMKATNSPMFCSWHFSWICRVRRSCLWFLCWLGSHTDFPGWSPQWWRGWVCLARCGRAQEGNVAVIWAVRFLSLVFVQGDDDCVLEVLWENTPLPARNEQVLQPTEHDLPTMLVHLCQDSIRSWGLPGFHLSNCFLDFFSCGGDVKFVFCLGDGDLLDGRVWNCALVTEQASDITTGVRSSMRLFADDRKVYRIFYNENDEKQLQCDLNTPQKWSENWQLRFHPDKCEVLRVTHARDHTCYPYKLSGCML